MDSVWQYRTLLLEGTVVTVQLALFSLLLAVIFGLIGATAKLSKNHAARKTAGAYTTLVRGVPDLVLMMFIFKQLEGLYWMRKWKQPVYEISN